MKKSILQIFLITVICMLSTQLFAQGIIVKMQDGTKKIIPTSIINGISVGEEGVVDVMLKDSTHFCYKMNELEKIKTFNYKEVVEIIVKTGKYEIDKFNQYSIYGTVEGVYNGVMVGFLLGEDPNINENNAQKTVPRNFTGGEFSKLYIESFKPGTTYYYCAYAEYEGETYYGQVESFTTPGINTKGSLNGHEWVDLGLPSGTKWATCNVGSNSIYKEGNYYAWGETNTKKYYDITNYSYSHKDIGDDISGTSYDVAHVRWGRTWHMPSKAQFEELLQCKSEWVSIDGTNGLFIWGLNDNTLFLPAAGYMWAWMNDTYNEIGKYWSSTASDKNIEASFCFSFSEKSPNVSTFGKENGFSVRPVCE